MLYMTVLTWDPDKRDVVIERAKKIGFEHPGGKTLGTWVETNGDELSSYLIFPGTWILCSLSNTTLHGMT